MVMELGEVSSVQVVLGLDLLRGSVAWVQL